jgi:hypothetical protein
MKLIGVCRFSGRRHPGCAEISPSRKGRMMNFQRYLSHFRQSLQVKRPTRGAKERSNGLSRRALRLEQLEDRCVPASGLNPSMTGVFMAVQQSAVLGEVLVTNASDIMVSPPVLGIAQDLLRQDARHLNQSAQSIKLGEQLTPSGDQLQAFGWQFLDLAVTFSEYRDSLLGLVFHVDLTAEFQGQAPTQPTQPPPAPTPGPGPSEGEQENSPAQVTLEGVSTTAFNPLTGVLEFTVAGASLTSDASNVLVLLNGQPIPISQIQLSPTAATVSYQLQDGRNDLEFVGTDTSGLPIDVTSTVWGGEQAMTVTALDSQGNPVSGAEVTAQLADDPSVVVTASTDSSGQVIFQNIPNRTIILTGTTPDNRLGTAAVTGNVGSAVLTLQGFNQPSPIANNDFSQGTSGWDTNNAPVQIVPHQEDGSQPVATAAPSSAVAFQKPSVAPAVPSLGQLEPLQASDDQDLQLTTSGEGPQSISRTFQVDPGTKNVTIRYRFITSEVPGGYFGSQYNDYYSVSLRSQKGGGFASDSNSMNGLGLEAFDANGATAWRELTLPVSQDGDTIQADITVANVADGLLDSQVIVDKIDQTKLAIQSAQLNDIDNTPLRYLSVSAQNPYFQGNTQVNGTLTITGDKNDSLKSLVLQIIQNGSVVATADLAPSAQSLLRPFGDSEKISVDTSQLLFQLSNAQAANIDVSQNGTLQLRLEATSANGQEVTKDVGSVSILTRYTGTNRYGGRDPDVGGDDWILPSVKTVLDHYSGITWGDMSNMNGGAFSPHASHQNGVDADGWFAGYNNRDAATAQTLIGYLNDPTYGSRIQLVGVTYQRVDGDPFWDAIKNVTLADGRRARDVIQPWAGHTTHFHWRISAS